MSDDVIDVPTHADRLETGDVIRVTDPVHEREAWGVVLKGAGPHATVRVKVIGGWCAARA